MITKNLFRRFSILLVFLFATTVMFAQNFAVSGTVKDNNGKALGGATILEKGTKNSAVSSTDGSFKINVASSKAVLVISYAGYEEMQVDVANQSQVSASLKQLNENLNDVVVVGYNVVKRKDVTGAVAGINQNDIKSRPVTNALQAMQGKVAGVDIGSNERPGTIGSINIRGVRSLAVSGTSTAQLSQPLFVVDGIPLVTGSIDNINPTDIESIDILKDASATAIYGSRGANGVVIVTTKQGKAGRVTLGLNSSVKLDDLVDNQTMFNSSDYITFRRWAYYYAGLNATTGISSNPRGDQPDIAHDRTYFTATADPAAWSNIAKGWASGTWDGSQVATTDWRGMVTQKSVTLDNTISVSGGTDKIKAYGSFGYLNNKGSIKGQAFERYTAKANVDISATNWLSFGSNINVSYGSQEFGQSSVNVSTIGNPAGGLYESARSLFSYAVPYDSLGNRVLFPGGDNAVKSIVDEWKYNIDQRVTLRAFGSFYAQFNFGSILPILKGLRYRMNFGPDISNYRDGNYIDANSVANGGSTSFASLAKNTTFSYTLDNLLYYDKSIGNHTFGLTLLASQTAYSLETSSISGNGVPLSSQLWNALTTGTVTGAISTSSNISKYQLQSYMARFNYSFKDKYLLTASIRRDGSSVFAEGHKYDVFPSVALAWRINKEGFLNSSKWINELKLRAGVGVTGNSAVQPYTTQGGVVSLFYPFLSSNVAGSIPNPTLANVNLGWEKTTQYNAGLDFSFFNRRVSGSVDVYTSTTNNILQQRNLPPVTGYTNTLQNIGVTANNGIDINLTTVNIKQKDFSWTTTINAAWQKEHIVSLSNGKQDDINNGWFIDQPIGVIYGYKPGGIWQKNDSVSMKAFNANGNAFTAGSVRVADVNGDNKIDPNNDRQIIGWTRPRWVVGMTNTINFKNWDFSFFLYGRLHYMFNYGGEGEAARSVNRQINYYTENNQNSDFQKPVYNAGGASLDPYYAALGYLNGSFIKVRNISLGYYFNNKTLTKTGMTSLRLYAQMSNPGMLFSKTKFLDMDVAGPTWNRGVTLGINASF